MQKKLKGLIERAIALADGNPPLLEWLNNEVLCREDAQARLTELETSSEDWKQKIIWEQLYQQIDKSLEKILSRCLVDKIPVPMAALEVICSGRPQYKEQLRRAIYLGLMEMSSEKSLLTLRKMKVGIAFDLECDRAFYDNKPNIVPNALANSSI